MINSVNITPSDAIRLRDEKEHVHISSNFSFTASHFGLRPKAMHVLLAPSHAGKTTFTLSLLASILKDHVNKSKNLKIACFWSEESVDDIALHLASMGLIGQRVADIDMMSEIDSDITELALFEYLEMVRPHLFIFDNLTTSKFYNDKNAKQQGEFLNKLKSIIKKNNICLWCVAHTDRSINMNIDRIITQQDVRGSKNIGNLAEFFYILQPVQLNNEKKVFLIIDKHRGYEVENKIFSLNYSNQVKTVVNDFPIPFKEFKEIFALRNTLKGRN